MSVSWTRSSRNYPPKMMRVTVENLSMIQMIVARHTDYILIAPEEAEAAIHLSGVPSADVLLVTFPDMPRGEKRYLMFSRQVEDETIRQISRYLDEYRALHK